MNIKELTKGLEEFISTDVVTESLNKIGDDSKPPIQPLYGIPPVEY
ncbi:hypothetical protein KQI42_02810 [Tissierella sp. MSJ-40]|uniref:Uncharacterized protein n=1 Tax=Tissierella simiarum TaxID=2841534 RepID=A0ABS6E1Z2_9FIRM|nr:hypothetical protein [Tissierella simiarum]MBU5436922.1 hypothetical protein [Tissierella simiarum]